MAVYEINGAQYELPDNIQGAHLEETLTLLSEIDGHAQKNAVSQEKADSNAKQAEISADQESDQEHGFIGRNIINLTEGINEQNRRFYEDVKQAGGRIGEAVAKKVLQAKGEPILPEGQSPVDQFTRETLKRRQEFSETPQGKSGLRKTITGLSELTPYLLAPSLLPGKLAAGGAGIGMESAKLAGRVAVNAPTGALIGASQFVGNEEDRATNAKLGAILNAGIPETINAGIGLGRLAVNSKAGQKINSLLGKKNDLLKESYLGKDLTEEALRRKRAGERLGVNLTPAEATGRPELIKRQQELTKSEGAYNKLYDAQEARDLKVSETIDDFKQSLGEEKNYASDLRDIAKGIIKEKNDALVVKADPYFKAADSKKIPPTHLKSLMTDDPIIENAVNSVLKDPVYEKEIRGYAPNSIKVLKLAKTKLQEEARSGVNIDAYGKMTNRGRLINDAAVRLNERLKKISPDYRKALSIYSEDLPVIKSIQDSPIGQIAKLDDEGLKNASRKLFDPTETDYRRLKSVRDEIYERSPDTWKGIVRNEIERKLDTQKGDINGSVFYNKILASPREYRQLLVALNKEPQYVWKLSDMKLAFKNLQDVSSSPSLSKSIPLSAKEAGLDFIHNTLLGKRDNAATELLLNSQWDKELRKVADIKNKPLMAKKFSDLLESVNKAIAVEATSPQE